MTPWWRRRSVVIAAGCLIALITFGARTSFGLFTEPLSDLRHWDRETFALAIAVQNLLWGLGQPFGGAIADRFGAARVLAAGGVIYALGVPSRSAAARARSTTGRGTRPSAPFARRSPTRATCCSRAASSSAASTSPSSPPTSRRT